MNFNQFLRIVEIILKESFFKITVILLLLAGCYSSCFQQEEKKISPCDLYGPYPYGIMPWVYETVHESLEKGIPCSIYRCTYRDGRGYLFEPSENSDDTGYGFRNCEGIVLYKGEEKSIEITYPELNIKEKRLILKINPILENDEATEEIACKTINPFTLPRVKEMIDRCKSPNCLRTVSICNYKDGMGFLLGEHLSDRDPYYEFLDCTGTILCNAWVRKDILCPDLHIDFENSKNIITSFIPLTIK